MLNCPPKNVILCPQLLGKAAAIFENNYAEKFQGFKMNIHFVHPFIYL